MIVVLSLFVILVVIWSFVFKITRCVYAAHFLFDGVRFSLLPSYFLIYEVGFHGCNLSAHVLFWHTHIFSQRSLLNDNDSCCYSKISLPMMPF